MSNTYAQLLLDVEAWAHREDKNLLIPRFISLAESAMYENPVAPLLIRALEFTSTATTSGLTLAMPEYFERARSLDLVLGDAKYNVKFKTPQQMRKLTGTGIPTEFTVIGTEIEFNVVPDNSYTVELQYYRKAAPLTATNQTNEVITNHYNIYLFGVLSELFSNALDTEQESRYKTKFYEAIRGANKAAKKGRYGPAPSASLQMATP